MADLIDLEIYPEDVQVHIRKEFMGFSSSDISSIMDILASQDGATVISDMIAIRDVDINKDIKVSITYLHGMVLECRVYNKVFREKLSLVGMFNSQNSYITIFSNEVDNRNVLIKSTPDTVHLSPATAFAISVFTRLRKQKRNDDDYNIWYHISDLVDSML